MCSFGNLVLLTLSHCLKYYNMNSDLHQTHYLHMFHQCLHSLFSHFFKDTFRFMSPFLISCENQSINSLNLIISDSRLREKSIGVWVDAFEVESLGDRSVVNYIWTCFVMMLIMKHCHLVVNSISGPIGTIGWKVFQIMIKIGSLWPYTMFFFFIILFLGPHFWSSVNSTCN